MSDTGKMYLHVPRFRIGVQGRSYQFGAEENLFFRDLSATEIGLPVHGVGHMPVDAVLRDYFDESGFRHHQNVRMPTAPSGSCSRRAARDHSSGDLASGTRFRTSAHGVVPIKAIAVQVRVADPHEEQILDSWWATAPHGSFRAVEIEACGCVHHGASKYLYATVSNCGVRLGPAELVGCVYAMPRE